MKLNKKLNSYVNNMQIPEANKVLPEEIRNLEQEVKKPTGIMKYKNYVYGGAGFVAACAAMVLFINMPGKNDVKTNSGHKNSGIGSVTEAVNNFDLDGKPDKTEKVDKETWGDGEITSKPGKHETSKGEAVMDETVAGDWYDDTYFESEELGGDYTWEDEYEYNGVTDAHAGSLTGGEIRDCKNWDNWTKVMEKSYLKPWKLMPDKRVCVYVCNETEALNNVSVRLVANQQVIYSAVTDIEGNAYLYYNYNLTADDEPDTIEVMQKDGGYASYSLSEFANSKNEVEIMIDDTNKELQVDLMFVVDTTGSMGDELEFLKAEIQDVIERSSEATDAKIRTSVNFYRDEGDEYVVKYYDFREDASEVADLVGEQSADGGGDYPEAVHTALNNAINEHNWSDDSTVKLMFLILDAPPHDDEKVVDELVSLIEQAAEKGIRIIPIAASGAGEDTQQMLRAYSIMTGGTFIFLDDNSGIGYSHEVTVDENEYNSEYLNDMIIRVIGEYCGKDIQANKVDQGKEQNQSN